jgi:hypothetical protein
METNTKYATTDCLDRYSIQYSDGLHFTTKEKFITRELFITFALNYFDA